LRFLTPAVGLGMHFSLLAPDHVTTLDGGGVSEASLQKKTAPAGP
jgi:hypothetical protein